MTLLLEYLGEFAIRVTVLLEYLDFAFPILVVRALSGPMPSPPSQQF